ncbi:hypothetical protein AMECASPLE_031385 [Ameca splendens]|uniref:Uncharacterized protein n=1 Tax=Ameca splendens TaxID=208324 RepID=A0ABV1A1Q1_9TELE
MPHKGAHMTNMSKHPRTHGAEPTERPEDSTLKQINLAQISLDWVKVLKIIAHCCPERNAMVSLQPSTWPVNLLAIKHNILHCFHIKFYTLLEEKYKAFQNSVSDLFSL